MTWASAPVAPLGAHDLLVLLLQLSSLLGLAVLLGKLATRIGMSAVVGELAAGVLLGPSVLNHLAPAVSGWLFPAQPGQFHLLDAVGQVGLLLLVGYTGTHIDLGFIRRRAGSAAGISVAGIVLPAGLGIAAGYVLPATLIPHASQRLTFALFLGVAMGVSAIPVLAKTLLDLNLLHRDLGQITLCAAMIDDIAGWVMLSVVTVLATGRLDPGDVVLSIAYVVLVLVVAWLARPGIRLVLNKVRPKERDGHPVAVIALLVLLGAAGTQALGLEAAFGAFVTGIAIKSSGASPAHVEPLRSGLLAVLVPVFFATAGLRMDLTALARLPVLLTGLGILAAAIAGKFAGAYAGARLGRFGHWEGLAFGAGMNSRGVIEVIIATVGLRLNILGPEMYTIIVLVAIVTSTMAPPLLRLTMRRVELTQEERLREQVNRPPAALTPEH
ncbi:cation:proton antiporter [Amycolatopsis sp. NPDC021455]|uniref:cation:proton antiporter n=1 Tax=Amycolatopsis sp. NPDC021455 TaxID=3154901 RepID=UPI0033C43BA9